MTNLRFASWLRACAAAVLAAGSISVVAQGCALESDVTPPTLPDEACAGDGNCDDGNPCTLDTCGPDQLCVHAAVPDGAAPVQVPGDCKSVVCAGGLPTEMDNDADFADDANPCTDDFCGLSGAAHSPRASGALCAVGDAAGTCDGQGTCVVACDPSSPTDCDTGNPCSVGTCDAITGACSFEALSGHPELFVQTAGDCRARLCVAGAEVAVVDDGDLPVTPSDCDQEFCSGGVPSNPPLAMGTPCGPAGADVCDGNGACGQCNVVDDCADVPVADLPPNSSCGVRACNAQHQCVFELAVPDGTEVDLAVGDCKQFICQAGEIQTVADPGDPTNDGNECTQDLCSGTTPQNPPLDGTACGQGLSCVTGQCICQMASQCPDGKTAADPVPTCRTPVCNANGACGFTFAPAGTLVVGAGIQTAGDCKKWVCDGAGNVQQVNDDVDVPVDGNACSADVCTNGVPSNPAVVGQTCNLVAVNDGVCSAAKTCVQCNQASDCNDDFNLACAAPTCVANACVPNYLAANQPATQQTPNDCKIVLCNGSGTPLPPSNDNGDLPLDDGNPCTDEVCSAGAPQHPIKPQFTDCGGGNKCDAAGNCDKANGATGCAANGSDCASGFCVDGRCCESACNQPCRSCGNATGTCTNLTSGVDNNPAGACSGCKECGAGGVCNNVGAGLDPNNACNPQAPSSCGLDGSCDGAGSCRSWDATTPCAAASCTAGSLGVNFVDLCSGSGTCVDSGTMDCGNYLCASGACNATCTSDAQCDLAVAYCNTGAGSCDAKLPAGSACAASSNCSSGVCLDNVCCAGACSGCKACKATLTGQADGTCADVLDGTDPHNTCNPSACAAGAETGSVCVAGVCGGSVSCGFYACNGTACRATCTQQAHCLTTGWCDTAVSQCKADLGTGSACTLNEQCTSNVCSSMSSTCT